MNIQVEKRLMEMSPDLRRKARELARLARDLKMCALYGELLTDGDGKSEAIRILARRFSSSESTVKRAIKNHSVPPWKKRR